MKTFAFLILFGVSVFAADTTLRVATTIRTNESGSISTKEVFTRDGHTNLVRNTSAKSGVVRMRAHRFYHDGLLVGMLTSTPDSSRTTSWAGCPYSMDFEYGSSNQLRYAAIIDRDGVLVDAFACTNAVLFPVASADLRDAPAIAADAKKLMSRERKVSSEQFRQDVGQMLEKYDK